MAKRLATIGQYLNSKELGVEGTGRPASAKTLSSYRTQLNLAERLTRKELRELTESDVRYLFRTMDDEDLSPSTRNLTLVALRNFFKWTEYTKLPVKLERNVFEDIQAVTIEASANTQVIDEDMFLKLVAKVRELEDERKEEIHQRDDRTKNFGWANETFSDKYILLMSVMFYGGVRINEAVTLLKENVRDNGIVVNGKGNRDRFVPLPSRLIDALKTHIEAHKWGPYVFYGETGRSFIKGSAPLGLQRFYSSFRDAADAIGLDKDFTPHNLRHSFGTLALRKTKRIEVVQDLLGHKNTNTTRIYAKLAQDDLVEEYNKIFD